MDEILPVSQFAEMLNLPHVEVIRRIRRGDIKASKLGWNWVIEATEVEVVKKSDWYKKRIARQAQQASLS